MDIKQIINWIKARPHELWWRLLSWLLTTLVVMPNILFAIYFVYMGENDFFSYDFFQVGSTGTMLFFILPVLVILPISLMITSIFILGKSIYISNKNENNKWVLITGSYVKELSVKIKTRFFKFFQLDLHKAHPILPVIYLIPVCYVLMLLVRIMNIDQFLNGSMILIVLAISMGFHFYVLLTKSAKSSFISMISLIVIIIFLCISTPKTISDYMGSGLRIFGMGGDRSAAIKLNNNDEIEGKLKLISPNYIYLLATNDKNVTTIPLSQVTYYKILDEPESKDKLPKVEKTIDQNKLDLHNSVCKLLDCDDL